MNTGRNNLSQSAGGTLLLEVFDSVSSELLARVVDTQSAGDSSFMISRNRLSNRADAEVVLKKWAVLLGTALQNARASAKAPAGKS
jgi:hypothetical protein